MVEIDKTRQQPFKPALIFGKELNASPEAGDFEIDVVTDNTTGVAEKIL
jgi:hypothetical protein